MKIIHGSDGGRALKITRAEWESIGKQAGWRDMLPSERMYGRHQTTSEIDEPEEEFSGGRRRDPEEEAFSEFTSTSRRTVQRFLDEQVAKAIPKMRALLDEAAAGGVGRQDAMTRAASILVDILEHVKGVDKKADAIGRLRGFLASPAHQHPGVERLRGMVKELEGQLGAEVKMPTPQEFKPEDKKEDVTAMGSTRIRMTREAWTRIGKRKGWIGTDNMEAEVKEDAGKLVVQIPGGKESEVEFSYTLTLKPHDKTDSPVRKSTYRITGSSPKLSEKEMEFAREQVKKWMKEHGVENIEAE